MKRFFIIGSIFGILGLSGLQDCDTGNDFNTDQIELSTKNTKDWNLAARSQLSGFGRLVVGIDKICRNH